MCVALILPACTAAPSFLSDALAREERAASTGGIPLLLNCCLPVLNCSQCDVQAAAAAQEESKQLTALCQKAPEQVRRMELSITMELNMVMSRADCVDLMTEGRMDIRDGCAPNIQACQQSPSGMLSPTACWFQKFSIVK